MPEPTITKTYTLLSEIPRAKIGNCGAVLPNHMQCWRAGDVQVTAVEKRTEGKVITEKVSSYQLCRGHAAMEQQQAK